MRAIDHPPEISPDRASDLDLMQASGNQPELFAEIFDRHSAAIHRYLTRRVGEIADDLLSETFLAAFRKRSVYRPERVDVLPWLYGIAANLVRRHHRAEATRYRMLARANAVTVVSDALDDFVAVDGRADAVAVRRHLAAALNELRPEDREVLLLVAWADLTQLEVAAALDLPPGTVRSRLHRSRKKVQLHLARAGFSPDASLAENILQLPSTPDFRSQS